MRGPVGPQWPRIPAGTIKKSLVTFSDEAFETLNYKFAVISRQLALAHARLAAVRLYLLAEYCEQATVALPGLGLAFQSRQAGKHEARQLVGTKDEAGCG